MCITFKFTIYSATFCLIFLSATVDSLIRRRYFHDGILYDDYSTDSDNVRYSVTGSQWNDLDELVKSHNLSRKAMFCTRGVGIWLLYPGTDFSYGSKPREITVVNGENCQPVDAVKSVQPLGPLNFKTASTHAVIGFTEKFFASQGKMLGSDSETIKSAIFLGLDKWTVTGGEKPLCITSTASEGILCLVEDTVAAFKSESITIAPGCDDTAEMEEYGLQSCYSQALIKIKYASEFSKTDLEQICAGDYDSSSEEKDKFLNVMDVLDARLHEDLFSADFVEDNSNNSDVSFNALRSDMLNSIYRVMATCTAADKTYLQIVLYIYKKMILQSGQIWDNDMEPNTTAYENYLEEMATARQFLSQCAMTATPVVRPECSPRDISEMKSHEEMNVIEEFLTSDSNDFIIEQIWLMMNYASTHCHTLVGFIDNHWIEFEYILKREFMNPVKEQWKNPGKWANYYGAMFNGFDLNFQRKLMIGCLQDVIIASPAFDPLSRPPEFYSDVNTAEVKDAVGNLGHNTEETQERRKRQHEPSPESNEAQLVLENKLGSEKAQGSDFIPTKTTATPSTTTKGPSTTSTQPTTSTTVSTTTSTTTETPKPKNKGHGRKHSRKERKPKRGKRKNKDKKKGKRGQKRSKLMGKHNEETPDLVQPVSEDIL